MSADHGYVLNQAALLTEAAKWDACEAFRAEAGGSRWHCSDCGQTLAAHVAVALRAKLAEHCGSCRHGNDADAVGIGHTYCTKPGGEWNGKLLPMAGRCETWEAAPKCRACDDTLRLDVTYNSDPTNSRTIICDQCEAGREAARAEAEREAATDGR
jgi:transcription elongation factor Elf1